MYRVKCDQCLALVINGNPSHEIGCPNSQKDWFFDGKFNEVYPIDSEPIDEFPDYEFPPNDCYAYED